MDSEVEDHLSLSVQILSLLQLISEFYIIIKKYISGGTKTNGYAAIIFDKKH
jgi:hypothetical protein